MSKDINQTKSNPNQIMNKLEFAIICQKHTVDPSIALEDRGLRQIIFEYCNAQSEDRNSLLKKIDEYIENNF